MDVILCFSSCWINYFSSLSVTRTNWCVQRGMSDGAGRRHTLLCVSASVFEGGGRGKLKCSKMSAPVQCRHINIYIYASLERIKKNSTLLKASSNQSIQRVFLQMCECFWRRATTGEFLSLFDLLFGQESVKEPQIWVYEDVKWRNQTNSHNFLTSLWWFFF